MLFWGQFVIISKLHVSFRGTIPLHASYYMNILMEVHLDLRISHFINYSITLASLVAQMVKNLAGVQETWA